MDRRRYAALFLGVAGVVTACVADDPLSGPDDGSSSFPIYPGPQDLVVEEWSDVAVSATSMAFLPDGDALVITKGGWNGPGVGLVKRFDSSGRFVADVGEIPVCADAERGLLGIAVDPDYEENRFVYLYYTRQMSDCALNEADTAPVWNRVSRVSLEDGKMDLAGELVVVDEIPAHQSSHNAGDLEFAPDGMLLVATGEAAGAGDPHDPADLNAKILRIDTKADDFSPDDNPFVDKGFPANLVYSTGLRNPYRIAVDSDGTIVAADVGRDDYEELNLIEAGVDYGWPETEGPDTQTGSAAPIGWYRHLDGCEGAVIGGDFVGEDLVSREDGRSVYVYSDMLCQNVIALELEDGEIRRGLELATTDRQLGDVITGPDGALYLVPIGPGEFPIQRLSRQ